MEISHRIYLSQNNSLIGPYLTYGICGWGNCTLTFQRKIVTLRTLLSQIELRSPSQPIFSEIVAIYCRISIDRQHQLVYSINLLKQVRFITTEKTISVSSDSFYVKFSGTDNVYTFFTRIGSEIWNSIPHSIKMRLFVKR